jgi:mannose-6-phosphate isomerase-like protein (cupin superfamily)
VDTGHDAGGRAVFLADGPPPHAVSVAGGPGVAEHLWLNGPATSADDGEERAGAGFDLEPPPGGCSVRTIRIPAPASDAADADRWLRVDGDDPALPGMHATDTLDLVVVLDGEIVLGLDDGEHHLGRGDCVVQRGTRHRWRVTGSGPCTYAAVMLRPDPDAGGATPVPMLPASADRSPDAATATGWRRIVTGTGDDGRSRVVAEGVPPAALRAGGTTLAELWQTGGRLADPRQGGDPDGDWQLEPRGRAGIAFRSVVMPPGQDPGDAGWHTTATIDVDIVVSGRVEMHLPDLPPVVLGPGDAIVQRGTHHKWVPIGDEPVRWVVVMLAVGE